MCLHSQRQKWTKWWQTKWKCENVSLEVPLVSFCHWIVFKDHCLIMIRCTLTANTDKIFLWGQKMWGRYKESYSEQSRGREGGGMKTGGLVRKKGSKGGCVKRRRRRRRAAVWGLAVSSCKNAPSEPDDTYRQNNLCVRHGTVKWILSGVNMVWLCVQERDKSSCMVLSHLMRLVQFKCVCCLGLVHLGWCDHYSNSCVDRTLDWAIADHVTYEFSPSDDHENCQVVRLL